VDAQGEFISGPTYGGAEDDESWSVDFTDDSGYVIAGNTKSYGTGSESMFIIRSDGDTLNGAVVSVFDPVGIPTHSVRVEPLVRPQPVAAGGTLTIGPSQERWSSARIIGLQGGVVAMMSIEKEALVVPEIPAGLYIIELSTPSGFTVRERLIVQ
jgi:hypothetical protein